MEISGGVAVLEAEEEVAETLVEFQPAEPEPEPQIAAATVESPQLHWLLSLYTPAAERHGGLAARQLRRR